MPLVGLFIVSKSVYYLCYLLSHAASVEAQLNQVDLWDVRSANGNQTNHRVTNIVDCLETNCLRKDLIVALPVFSLCKPTLKLIYNPLVDLHTLGAVILVAYVLVVLMLSIGSPCYLHLDPQTHATVMFDVAPNIGRDALRTYIKSFMAEIYISLMSYVTSTTDKLDKMYSCQVGFYGQASASSLILLTEQKDIAKVHYEYAREMVAELGQDLRKLNAKTKFLIDDCLSLFRCIESCRLHTIEQHFITLVWAYS